MFSMSRDEVGILGILTFLLPVTPLVYMAVTRVIHTFRSLPCFWSVSQLLFCTFILAYTICRQVSFGLPLLRFPSGAQNCFLKLFNFLLSTLPSQFQRLLNIVEAMSSQTTVEKALILVELGQHSLKILLRDFVWNVNYLPIRSLSFSGTLNSTEE